MSWLTDIKRPVLYFSIASLAVVAAALGLFYYALAGGPEQKVLGVQVAADANSLFGSSVRLVKTANSPKVYALIGKQKYPIRNEDVFRSYSFSFAKVQLIGQKELDSYALVHLAKEEGTGRIYYLSYEKNLKKYHATPDAFAAYPANSWANVVTLSQKDLSYWQSARVLKAINDPKIYFIDGNRKAWIPDEDTFREAGFSWGEILTVFAQDLATYQDIDFSSDLVLGTQTVQPTTETPATQTNGAGQLIVSLSANSPAASLFPLKTARNTAAVFKLQAVRDNTEITGITLTKRGVSGANALDLIVIEDENGVAYGSVTRPNGEGKAVILFTNKTFVIPRDTEKRLVVKINVSTQAKHNDTVSLGITAAADVQTNSSVSGIFPVFGAEHKLVDTQNFIGAVSITSRELNTSARPLNLGTKKETVAEFTVSETSGNEDVALTSITFSNEGTTRDDDVDYVYLYKDGAVVATNKYMLNHRVTFDLQKSPVIIKKKNSVTLQVKIDPARDEDATLKFVITEPGDVSLVGRTQQFGIAPASAEGFPVGYGSSADANKVVFRLEGIGLLAASLDSDEEEIYRDMSNAVFGVFELRNLSQETLLQRMQVKLEKITSDTPDIESDLILYDATNKKEIASFDHAQLVGGAVAGVNIGGYAVAASKTLTLKFLADVPEDSAYLNAYRVIVQQLDYSIGTASATYSTKNAVVGQTMHVLAPAIAVTAGTLKNGGTESAGKEEAELANFYFKASADERILITEITVSLASSSDELTYTSGFSNLALYAGSTRVSGTIVSPTSRTYTFTGLKISVSAGTTYSLQLRADTELDTADTDIQLKLDKLTAQGYTSKAPALVTGEGTVSSAVHLHTP
jgi:hypothetical protein